MNKFQFVTWFPKWKGFCFFKVTDSLSCIYDWCFFFGFWEIRKWHNLTKQEG